MIPDPVAVANDFALAIADTDECPNVAEAAALYTDALRTYGPDGVEWSIVNRAIIKRWSKSALERIKRAARKEASRG